MGYDIGAHHVWGVLLSSVNDTLASEIARLFEVADKMAAGVFDEDDEPEAKLPSWFTEAAQNARDLDTDLPRTITRHYREKVAEALKAAGLELPDGARLIWTGDGGDRPAGRCATPEDDIVVGWGMFLADPRTFAIRCSDAFFKMAEHHHWVWGG